MFGKRGLKKSLSASARKNLKILYSFKQLLVMQISRIQDTSGKIHYAAERGSHVYRIEGDLYGAYHQTEERLTPVKRLAPIQPTAIFCIGLNYRAHADEMGSQYPQHPIVFMKNPAAVLHPDDPIELPRHLHSDQVDYEAELAVVIGKRCKNVSAKDALDYVLGYTAANDVSARDWQKFHSGGQWVKGKSFDTFCPLGPSLITADDIPNPQILPIRGILNGEIRQESWTGDMIFSVAELVAFLSASTTLLPGTIILTGTPPGVGMAANPQRFLKQGDEIAIEITGIGTLRNPVVDERLT